MEIPCFIKDTRYNARRTFRSAAAAVAALNAVCDASAGRGKIQFSAYEYLFCIIITLFGYDNIINYVETIGYVRAQVDHEDWVHTRRNGIQHG